MSRTYPTLPLAWDARARVYRYVGAQPVYLHRAPGLRGIDAQTGTQIVATGGTIASGTIIAAGTAGTLAASTVAIAVPVIGAAVLAVTLVIGNIARKNAQKTAATKIVDEVGPQMKANLDAYMNGPRTRSSQRQALYNFDALWQLILDNCGQPALGSAGERCISAQRGGIAPWCPTPDHRGCDAFTAYETHRERPRK